MSSTTAVPGLSVRHLSKMFGSSYALRDVSFDVRPGSIHGLLGGNGSGKSTLIKILAGVHRAEQGGEIQVGGTVIGTNDLGPETAAATGLRFVHQDPGVFPTMTIAENIALGSAGGFPHTWGKVSWRALHRRVSSLLERYEIAARPNQLLGDLRPADRTMVAVARALQTDDAGAPSVLVLDEPTASLPHHEVDVLLGALRRRAAEGQTVLYVSHRMEEVMDLVDDLTVLRDGRHVITRPRPGMTTGELIDTIVGQPVRALFSEVPAHRSGEPVLRIRGLAGGPLRGIDLTVHAGEVVGIAGLLGSGRSELLRMVFGDLRPDAGSLELQGRAIDPKAPADAMRQRIGLVPENRATDAAFPDQPISRNLSVARIGDYASWRGIRAGAEKSAATAALQRYGVKAAGPTALMSSLSGGNAQKVVLGRWLDRKPVLLLLDEPTQGVDVGARSDLYTAIRSEVEQGMAALLVSSDFEELAHACDRVLVLRNGRIRADVSKNELSSHHLTELLYAEETA